MCGEALLEGLFVIMRWELLVLRRFGVYSVWRGVIYPKCFSHDPGMGTACPSGLAVDTTVVRHDPAMWYNNTDRDINVRLATITGGA